jgi:hypothetical protein
MTDFSENAWTLVFLQMQFPTIVLFNVDEEFVVAVETKIAPAYLTYAPL